MSLPCVLRLLNGGAAAPGPGRVGVCHAACGCSQLGQAVPGSAALVAV